MQKPRWVRRVLGALGQVPRWPGDIRRSCISTIFTLTSGRGGDVERTAEERAEGNTSSQRQGKPRARGVGPWRGEPEGEEGEKEEKNKGCRPRGTSGYKRHFYRKLAGSASESSGESCSRKSRKAERREGEGKEEGPRCPVDEVTTTGCRWEEEKEKEERQEGSELKPLQEQLTRRQPEEEEEKEWRSGLQPELLEWQWPDEWLRRELQRGLRGSFIQQLGRPENGAPPEEEGKGEAWERSPAPSGACEGSAGPKLQSSCGQRGEQELHHGGEAELLLLHHHQASGGDYQWSGSRDAPAELLHGCLEGRSPRSCGRPAGGALHQPPSVAAGWQLDGCASAGTPATGGDISCRAPAGSAGKEAGQARGQGLPARLVACPRRRQGPWQPGKRVRLARSARRAKGQNKERRKRQGQGQVLVGTKRRWERAGPQQEEGEAKRQMRRTENQGKEERLGSFEPLGTSAFGCAGIRDFKSSIPCCTSYRALGCVLAWWLIHGAVADDLIFRAPQWMETWKGFSAAANLSAARGRNSVFPFREGDLNTFTTCFKEFSLEEVASPEVVSTWSASAWLFNVVSALNKLAGYKGAPYPGRWTQSEQAAAESMRTAIERRCARDVVSNPLTESDWWKELSGRQVGYNGEEISTCQQLSWEQVIPSLPPEEHGGSIETLHWVSPRTREFLLNPSLLLKSPDDVKLPKLPGKIHVKPEDKMAIAHELVRRNICSWVPLELVYKVGSLRILNGLLKSGESVLRLIMNLTGSNATQHQLEGGASNLPSITSWQSLVLEQGQSLEMFQSDMSSAFYLFKIPPCWHRHLAFNVIASEEELMGHGRRQFALCCSVLPMGWLNSVSIMQEVSENILLQARLNPYNQVARSNPLPRWFTEILETAEEADRCWWHVYLDNFCACERIEADSPALAGSLCHEAAEDAWRLAGVISSEKKRVSAASYIQELGAEVDGEAGALGVSTQKLHKLGLSTLWTLVAQGLDKKQAQILAGRWIFVLQFRRPAMGFLQEVWKVTSGGSQTPRLTREKAKG